MIIEILNEISIYSIFVPILIGLFNYSNLETNARVLMLILAFAFIPQIATVINKPAILPVFFYNGYILVEALLWPMIFILSVQSNTIKNSYFLIWFINFIVPLIYIFFFGLLSTFHSPMVCLNSLLQIIYTVLFFYDLNQRNAYINLKREPMLWFCLGLLFYSTCTFFLFLFYKKINKYMTKSELNILWQIHNFFNILMYLLFSAGLAIKKRNYV